MRHKSLKLAAALIAIGPMAANATPLALDITTDGGAGLEARDFTLGWAFTVSEAITLDALGTWDQDADGLNQSQNVSLWTSDGILLASALVDNGSTAVASVGGSGQWLFTDIVEIMLGVGDYVIGADRAGGSADVFQIGNTVFATDSRVTWNESRFSDANSFGFPLHTTQGDQYFGPNFAIAVPVPEPTTLSLLGAGLIGFGLTRRRKRVA